MICHKETYTACPFLEYSNGCLCSLRCSSVFQEDSHVWMTCRHRRAHILALCSSLRQIESPFFPSGIPWDPSARPCCAMPLPAFLTTVSHMMGSVPARIHICLGPHKDQMGHMFSCEPSVWSKTAYKTGTVYRQVPLSAKSSLSKL